MISMDMKYTALYWALRYIEDDLDIHCKKYNGYKITINAEQQTINYGNKIRVVGDTCHCLKRHKDFVILECVDRLLLKGYLPEDICILGDNGNPDIVVGNIAIICEQWGKDYENKNISDMCFEDYDSTIIYSSRLVSGLLEYKNTIFINGNLYTHGFFEENIGLFELKPTKERLPNIEKVKDIDDFEISEDELVRYKGKSTFIHIPEGITTIGASAFWNNTFIEEVELPHSLKRIGGDCFYYCTNLRKITISENVWIMGNNPFAGCPNLILKNKSKFFILSDGVLFNAEKTNLIYYQANKVEKEYKVPNSVICLGKHCFYACNNLHKIIVSHNVIRFENNPFSGCEQLEVENYSPYYIFENGIIYNKFKTTIIGCLNKTKIDKYIVPESVTLISRNSFWNCKGIGKLIITRNVNRIGYNPFAGCVNMIIESNNNNFIAIDGYVYDSDKTHLLCCTNKAAGKKVKILDSVQYINRGVFSGCVDMEQIDFNNVTYIDKSSFTNCQSLKELFIPDAVTYIGEWAFSYCTNLEKISIGKHTYIDKNAFNECPCKIEIRG